MVILAGQILFAHLVEEMVRGYYVTRNGIRPNGFRQSGKTLLVFECSISTQSSFHSENPFCDLFFGVGMVRMR